MHIWYFILLLYITNYSCTFTHKLLYERPFFFLTEDDKCISGLEYIYKAETMSHESAFFFFFLSSLSVTVF